MTNIRQALGQRLTDAVSAEFLPFTPRSLHLPQHEGKALAVIGVRRAGKTTYLRQLLVDRLQAGRARESLILLGLEDDRLAGLEVADLDWMLEEYFRRYPSFRRSSLVTLCLDEIQVVPDWERFVRRVLDTETVEILLSGSSAKLLSREVATSLRGRGMELLVHPFSFREALRHAGNEPSPSGEVSSVERSELNHALSQYLVTGGFPEAQRLDIRDHTALLRGYVDVVVLRDVIERHAVSNPTALRWMQRQLLGNPAGAFSVNRLFKAMKAEGVAVSKDTLHEYLAYLEDAFLVRTVPLAARSAKRRMVNPRKAYPVDPGLIGLFSFSPEPETGRALETVVMLELERRGYEVGYVRTRENREVDFLARTRGQQALLIQVCTDVSNPQTFQREVEGLLQAQAEHAGARSLLLTLDQIPPRFEVPDGIEWLPAATWLLEASEDV